MLLSCYHTQVSYCEFPRLQNLIMIGQIWREPIMFLACLFVYELINPEAISLSNRIRIILVKKQIEKLVTCIYFREEKRELHI